MLRQKHESYTYLMPQKIELIGQSLGGEKCHNLKNVNCEKKVAKAKKQHFYIL